MFNSEKNIKKNCAVLACNNENSCMDCPVRQLSLLEGLSLKDLAVLNNNRSNYDFKAGAFIYKEGEESKGLIALYGGKIKITKSGLFENKAIISLKRAGEFLGLKTLVLEKKYTTSAVALEDGSVCIIDKKDFLEILNSNPEFALRVLKLLAKQSEAADERMLVLTQKHLRGRLADGLLLLHERFGTLADNKTINIELKRADLAAISNMTAANAIRVLAHFSKEKFIELNKRQIKIIDFDGLKKVSQLG